MRRWSWLAVRSVPLIMLLAVVGFELRPKESLADPAGTPRSRSFPNGVNGVNGVAITPASVAATTVTATTVTATAGSGSNGFGVTTNGARIDFGGGANDYASSNGTTITFAGPVNMGNDFGAGGDNAIDIGTGSVRFRNLNIVTTNSYGVVTGGAGGTNVTSISPLVGAVNKNMTIVGTGADTTEDNLMTYTLPGNSMDVNARGVRLTAWGDGVSTVNVTTVRCYFGSTAIITTILTASQANTWRVVGEVLRASGTTQVGTASNIVGGTVVLSDQENSAPGETLSGNVTIKCTGQRATSSVANSIQQRGMIVEFLN